jgi:hypothetical protein
VAVTRTVLGGPEYSGRGGTQVVTLILLLGRAQFESYCFDPIIVARTAMMMGHLRLPLNMTRRLLPAISLPREPVIDRWRRAEGESTDRFDGVVDEVIDLIDAEKRVAVIGLNNPVDAVERLIAMLSPSTRRRFSFTTGLVPAVQRPFQAHFLSSPDWVRQRTLDAQNIIRVDAS